MNKKGNVQMTRFWVRVSDLFERHTKNVKMGLNDSDVALGVSIKHFEVNKI